MGVDVVIEICLSFQWLTENQNLLKQKHSSFHWTRLGFSITNKESVLHYQFTLIVQIFLNWVKRQSDEVSKILIKEYKTL